MILGVVGLALLLQLTTPATIHPAGILMVFICIYLLVLGVLTFFIYWGSRLYARGLASMTGKRYQTVSLATVYQYGTVISLAPVMLLAMRTVGGVEASDIVFVITFVALACFYIWRRQ